MQPKTPPGEPKKHEPAASRPASPPSCEALIRKMQFVRKMLQRVDPRQLGPAEIRVLEECLAAL